ncbi:MAG TPA: ABC transporter permease [Candidatus Nanopelagicaceae bacterium]|nr:ABC transporter permease [Candidatus Nanopelagicaceae bacterium]
MRAYLLRRAGISLLTLVIASIVVFLGVRAVPGSPAVALTGNTDFTPAALAAINRAYGLDKPLPVQYTDWVGQIVRGHLGSSPVTGLPITTEIGNAFPITTELTILSMLVALLLGIPTGILAAIRRGHTADYVSNGLALFGLSIPSFWFGIMLILLLSVHFSVLPSAGFVSFSVNPAANLAHLLMPAFVLGTGVAAVLMRQTRSGLLETLRTDYVRTARAKGLSEWVVVGKHALRNSLVTVATVIALQFGVLLSGVAVTEEVFGLPGIGQLTINAVFQRDYPTIQAVALLTAALVIIINLVMDLVYMVLSPKVRLAGDPG